MSAWPHMFMSVTATDDQGGETTVDMDVEYCCWTFCGWPEFRKALERRWRRKVRYQRCADCQQP